MGAFEDLFGQPEPQTPTQTQTQQLLTAEDPTPFDEVFQIQRTPTGQRIAHKTLTQPRIGEKIAALQATGVLPPNGEDTEVAWGDVPSNFIRGVGDFATGMVTLASAFFSGAAPWNQLDTAEYWSDVFSSPFDDDAVKSGRASDVADFYTSIFSIMKDELVHLGTDPIEALKKDPFGQLINLSMILSLGGTSIGKGAQVLGTGGKVAGGFTKVGTALSTAGRNIDPILLSIRGAGAASSKIPVVNTIVRGLKESSEFNRIMGIEQRISLKQAGDDIARIEETWGKLTPGQALNVESWIRGLSTPWAKGKDMAKMQAAYDSAIEMVTKYADEFGYRELGNLNSKLNKSYDNAIVALDDQIKTLNKGNPKLAKEADNVFQKILKDAEAPNLTEGSMRDIAKWGVEKYSPSSVTKNLLNEMVSKRLNSSRLKGEKAEILANSTINEQRAFQDLAVATGMRKRSDFGKATPKSVLTPSEIKELKKAGDAYYFPDKVIPKKTNFITKTKSILSPKSPSFSKKRTGKAKDAGQLLDPETALKVHAIQAAQHRAAINTATNIMSGLAKEGKVLPMLEGKILEGYSSVNINTWNISKEAMFRIEENLLDLMAKGESFEGALTKSAKLGEEIAKDLSKAPVPKFQIDNVSAKNLQNLFPNTPGFVKTFIDAPTNIFRTSVLALSPRWIVNGAMGNLVLNTVAGVGPIAYARMFPKFMDEMYKGFKDVNPAWNSWLGMSRGASLVAKSALGTFKKITDKGANLFEKAIGHEGRFFVWEDDLIPMEILTGLTDAEKYTHNFMRQTAAEVADTFVKKRGFADGMFDVNSAMDNYFRRVHYIDKASKTAAKSRMSKTAESAMKTIDDARFGYGAIDFEMWKTIGKAEKAKVVDNVEKFLFNYSVMSSVEKAWVRRIVPFWSWYRNINKFMFYTLPQMPVRRGIAKMISDVGMDAARDDDLPEWMHGSVIAGVNERGDHLYLSAKGMIPFSDTERTLQDPAKSIGLNPVISFPIEHFISKTDLFTGKPFDAEGQVRPGIKIDPVTGEETRVVPPFLQHLARQLPQLKLLEEFLAPAAVYDDSTLINPKIKRAHSKVEELRRKIIEERGGSRPKTRKQRLAKERKLAQLQVDYEKAMDERAKNLVEVWSIKGRETVEAKFPIDVKFRALAMFGLKITPIDLKEQKEFSDQKKKQAVDAKFKELYDRNELVIIDGKPIGFREFAESIKLEKSLIKSSREFQREAKRTRNRRRSK